MNREQELILIEIGLQTLLNRLAPAKQQVVTKKPAKKSKRKWSPEQREKFQASMKKVWERKKKLPKNK